MKKKYILHSNSGGIKIVSKQIWCRKKTEILEEIVVFGNVQKVVLDAVPTFNDAEIIVTAGYHHFEGGGVLDKRLEFSEGIPEKEQSLIKEWYESGKPLFAIKGFYSRPSVEEISGDFTVQETVERRLTIEAEEILIAEQIISEKRYAEIKKSGMEHKDFEKLMLEPSSSVLVFSDSTVLCLDGEEIRNSNLIVKGAIGKSRIASSKQATKCHRIVCVNSVDCSSFGVAVYGDFDKNLLSVEASKYKIPGNRHFTTLFSLRYDGRNFDFEDGSNSDPVAYLIDANGRSWTVDVNDALDDEDC